MSFIKAQELGVVGALPGDERASRVSRSSKDSRGTMAVVFGLVNSSACVSLWTIFSLFSWKFLLHVPELILRGTGRRKTLKREKKKRKRKTEKARAKMVVE